MAGAMGEYCVVCQESHRMKPACYQCRVCGERGHLARDCSITDNGQVEGGRCFCIDVAFQVKTEKVEIKSEEYEEIKSEEYEESKEIKSEEIKSEEIKSEEGAQRMEQSKDDLKDGPIKNNLPMKLRQQIITECVEELISPTELGRKYKCNPDMIRKWVRKAGHSLPKQYKN
jgi:hypothetical protein